MFESFNKGDNMKSNDKFRFPRALRGLLGSVSNKEARDTFRANIVQATLQSEIKPEKERKSK